MHLLASDVALNKANPAYRSAVFVCDAQTSSLLLTLQKPVIGSGRTWSVESIVRTRLIYVADGQEYVTEGSVHGGVKTSVIHGKEITQYAISVTPEWGFFGVRKGMPQRIGEKSRDGIKARVELELIAGSDAETVLTLSAESAPAPEKPFHSSVAFDAATDAQEIDGDGVLSLTHTATGSDRAAFAGVGWDSGSPASTSVTYNGVGMTEIWDTAFATFYGNAGYQLVAPATGAVTVTSTIASPDTNHALGVITMTGVHQTVPVGTHAFDDGLVESTMSVDVTDAAADDLVVDNLYVSNASEAWTAGANQTLRYSEIIGGLERLHGSTQLGSDGGVMSWSSTASASRNSLGAVAFKPSAGAAASVVLVPVIRQNYRNMGYS